MKRVTARRLRELLHYAPETGVFTWCAPLGRKIRPGRLAGKLHWSGYRNIRLDGRDYAAHRLAWLYMRGCWPAGIVTARDGNLANTRWKNLRVRSRRQLQQGINLPNKNNLAGARGVGCRGGKFFARITASGVEHYLGEHDTVEAASAAYKEAKKELHAR